MAAPARAAIDPDLEEWRTGEGAKTLRKIMEAIDVESNSQQHNITAEEAFDNAIPVLARGDCMIYIEEISRSIRNMSKRGRLDITLPMPIRFPVTVREDFLRRGFTVTEQLETYGHFLVISWAKGVNDGS